MGMKIEQDSDGITYTIRNDRQSVELFLSNYNVVVIRSKDDYRMGSVEVRLEGEDAQRFKQSLIDFLNISP